MSKSKRFQKINDVEHKLNELVEENRKLRNDLKDCEKFRHMIFKRLGELEL